MDNNIQTVYLPHPYLPCTQQPVQARVQKLGAVTWPAWPAALMDGAARSRDRIVSHRAQDRLRPIHLPVANYFPRGAVQAVGRDPVRRREVSVSPHLTAMDRSGSHVTFYSKGSKGLAKRHGKVRDWPGSLIQIQCQYYNNSARTARFLVSLKVWQVTTRNSSIFW